ncbi:hypothetical protein CNMCM8980_006982 [Aspergillus fumigatiaffinis]|nr:hypothetical protein CNMCM8980_006982 [Aspergillus fumigatiaffinis]
MATQAYLSSSNGAVADEPKSEVNASAAAKPSFPEGGVRAWSVVFGASIALGCAFGYLSAFGIYETYYSEHQLAEKTASEIAWIGSTQIFLQFATSLVSGSLFDLHGAKILLIPGSISFVFSIMMTSLCKQYYQVILAQGILGGLSTGFIFTPSLAAIGHYFQKKRGLAMGICAAGSSLGGLLFPIALKHALYSQRLGFGWGVRAVGFVVLGLLAIACALVRERLPPRKGQLFLPRAFLQPSYSFLVASVFLSFWGMWVPYFFIVSFAIQKIHMGGDLAFYTLSIVNAGSLLGRIIPGFLADRFGRLNMLVCVYAANSIMLLTWIRITTAAGLIAWAAVFGFVSGAVISLYPVSIAQLAPRPQEIGTYMGQASAIVSVAGLTGTPIAGALIRSYGYEAAALFAGLSMVICVYSISNNNTLQEAAHDATSGWYTSALSNNNFQVAANSTVGAAYLAGTQALRVYAQSPDNSIQEYGWDGNLKEWQTLSNLGAALPGTAIAVRSFSQPNHVIRVYFQDPQNNLIEMYPGEVHDANSGWYDGAFSQSGMPGSQVAAINWGSGSGLNIRVYFQQPQSVPGVSEYQYVNGNWMAGQIPIPPA